jgi:hypothetical protein
MAISRKEFSAACQASFSVAMTVRRFIAFIGVVAAGTARSAAVQGPVPSMPRYFEANQGQAAGDVDFISRGSGYTVFLTPNAADFELLPVTRKPGDAQSAALRLRLLGANAHAVPSGRNLQSARTNYLVGNTPALWHTDIPQFGRVEYRDVYPGIDLLYYENQQQLEYDFILGPQADPRRIQLAFEGARGIRVDDATGDIVVNAGNAEVRQKKPAVYQDTPQGRKRIGGGYVALGGNRVGFEIAGYDRGKPLVIDPVLAFSSYFGGTGEDSGDSVAVDAKGNMYLSGYTTAPDGQTGVAGRRLAAGSEAAYIAKIDPGGALIFSTYIAGSNDHAAGYGITVDKNGNTYLAGQTKAADFPTVNAIQPKYHGGTDAFLLELNSSGNGLLFSTFLGGSEFDYLAFVTIDESGNVYAAGATSSLDFPVLHAAQPKTPSRHFSAMALKIFPNRKLAYATYVGGENFTNAIATDASGDLYVAGDISADYLPCVNALQKTYGGLGDGFVQKLSPAGAVLYSTYIGGSATDAVRGLQVDPKGNLIIAGETDSYNFPVVNPIQRTLGDGMMDRLIERTLSIVGDGYAARHIQHTLGVAGDGFVAKLNSSGSALLFSTFLGGSDEDQIADVALDAAGDVYVTGRTRSKNFPTVRPVQAANAGGLDAFLTKINNQGSAILFSTYLGGSRDDRALHVAAGTGGRVYIAGKTGSADFPTVKAFQPKFGGGSHDAFIAEIDLGLRQ